LQNPILNKDISPFKQDINYDFKFFYNGTSQIVSNNLVIENAETSVVVYNATVNSFNLFHRLPANTLVNGNMYRAKIRLMGVNNVWSSYSDSVSFFVLANPVISIREIDYDNNNMVYSQAPLLSAFYVHENNETLSSYAYYLYDNNQSLIKKYPDVFYTGGLLKQQLDGLEAARIYYIEIRTVSNYKQQYSTGLIQILPFYITPKISGTISATNVPDKGALEVEANILQIIGYYKDKNGIITNDFKFTSGEKVNLRDGAVIGFQQNMEIPRDFNLQIWASDLLEDKVFLTLFGTNGNIIFYKYKNRIHAEVIIGTIDVTSHFVSNYFVSNDVDINIRCENHLIDLEVF
jgi:hypothetical protein